MFGLYFDGDLRRIYEVPEASDFVIRPDGFRVYMPLAPQTAETSPSITTTELWTAWVDWHHAHQWSSLAMSKSGGSFREFDSQGDPIFALFDLRLTNGWEFVPADYTHQPIIVGNLYPNIETGRDFDTSRIQSQGVSPRIDFADRGQTTVSSSGFTELDRERLERVDETLQTLNANNP